MALRTLDNEERAYLDKQIQKLNTLHLQAKNGITYSYYWLRLNRELHDLISTYEYIIESSKQSQYSEYLNNGGTMSLEQWEQDGRWDKI